MSENRDNRQNIDEHQVFDFLTAHPDFLERHPQLLPHLTIPHQTNSDSVSLVERQVKVLREKNRELQGKLIDMLKAAQENEEILAKWSHLVLCLIDCSSLNELTATLRDVMIREFELDAVSITLFGRWERVEAVRVYASRESIQQQLDCRFPDNEPVSGRLDSNIRNILFPGTLLRAGSVALLPLGKKASFGILAIASKDQLRFSPDMGSLFLELISAVTTQMIMKFKDFE